MGGVTPPPLPWGEIPAAPTGDELGTVLQGSAGTLYGLLPGIPKVIGGMQAKLRGRPPYGYGEGDYSPEDAILGLAELTIAAQPFIGRNWPGAARGTPPTEDDPVDAMIRRLAGLHTQSYARAMAQRNPQLLRAYLLDGPDVLAQRGFSAAEVDSITRALEQAIADLGRSSTIGGPTLRERLRQWFSRERAEPRPYEPQTAGPPRGLPEGPEAPAAPPPVEPAPPRGGVRGA